MLKRGGHVAPELAEVDSDGAIADGWEPERRPQTMGERWCDRIFLQYEREIAERDTALTLGETYEPPPAPAPAPVDDESGVFRCSFLDEVDGEVSAFDALNPLQAAERGEASPLRDPMARARVLVAPPEDSPARVAPERAPKPRPTAGATRAGDKAAAAHGLIAVTALLQRRAELVAAHKQSLAAIDHAIAALTE